MRWSGSERQPCPMVVASQTGRWRVAGREWTCSSSSCRRPYAGSPSTPPSRGSNWQLRGRGKRGTRQAQPPQAAVHAPRAHHVLAVHIEAAREAVEQRVAQVAVAVQEERAAVAQAAAVPVALALAPPPLQLHLAAPARLPPLPLARRLARVPRARQPLLQHARQGARAERQREQLPANLYHLWLSHLAGRWSGRDCLLAVWVPWCLALILYRPMNIIIYYSSSKCPMR
ncbi:hypothetical protein FIBSPDRAFT_966355 [Athelia psychrophila]|uniref:Uncharacterized protein n=1 Tax=Athelia psychrophila TaxID=1759441 RepID=A0A167WWI6_9AGAM|nr:hypothetical protein FIBSPDRAFT_966355 [Fibularhizoctonia sp. CBS 109695]